MGGKTLLVMIKVVSRPRELKSGNPKPQIGHSLHYSQVTSQRNDWEGMSSMPDQTGK